MADFLYLHHMKKLDIYLIKLFFGPFFFVFSVLFFIFLMNIVFLQLDQYLQKGLNAFQILKVLYYTSPTVVSLVLPLTVLLSSIMVFGGLGERYELAAMRAAGISLVRIMQPLFFTSIFLGLILFLFSNNVIPDFQKKGKNMFNDILTQSPTLNFSPGRFIHELEGYRIKFNKKSGVNGENLTGVYIIQDASTFQPQKTIYAEKGLLKPGSNPLFLHIRLFNGTIFEETNTYDINRQNRQEDRMIKFGTLDYFFDVSKLYEKQLESQTNTDNYTFKTFPELSKTIRETSQKNLEEMQRLSKDAVNMNLPYISLLKDGKIKVSPMELKPKEKLVTQKKELELTELEAIAQLKGALISDGINEGYVHGIQSNFAKMVMYQQRILSYPVTLLLFFIIGASLGSIIRKGGLGVPVIIAVILFILFFVMNLTVENLSWSGTLEPYFATWIPNLVLLPLSIIFTNQALKNGSLFQIEKYKALLKPILRLFPKRAVKEHSRYS